MNNTFLFPFTLQRKHRVDCGGMGLDAGAIAGIVVGVVVGLIVLLWLLLRGSSRTLTNHSYAVFPTFQTEIDRRYEIARRTFPRGVGPREAYRSF